MNLWNCEMKEVAVLWPVEHWPMFCPFCGRQVHPELSTHHEMQGADDPRWSFTEAPKTVWMEALQEDTDE